MVNVPCFSMGTAPRSNSKFSLKSLNLVKETSMTYRETPGPG